jgi:4-carboxymuconolactone decarboxylase
VTDQKADLSPRIPPLPREEWTDAARDVFAFWEGPEARDRGSASNTMMTLANHPKLAIASLNFGKYLMLESELSGRQQKMIVLRVAWHFGSPYQWAHNSRSARQIGMTSEEIEALKLPPAEGQWSPEDRALLEAIDQLCTSGRISDATWAALQAVMNRHQIMDTIHAVGYFTMVAWSLIAMGVQLEPDFERFSTNKGKI